MDNNNKEVQGLLDLIKFAEDFIKEEDAKADALIKQINGTIHFYGGTSNGKNTERANNNHNSYNETV